MNRCSFKSTDALSVASRFAALDFLPCFTILLLLEATCAGGGAAAMTTLAVTENEKSPVPSGFFFGLE